MDAYATKLSEGFANRVIQRYFEESVSEKITNQDYEGEIKDTRSKVNILTFGAISLKNYTGSDLTVDDVEESVGELVTDQMKAHYFKIKSLDRFKSWIKNPEGTLLAQVANTLKETIDAYNLGLWGDVAAGNRVGTNYTTGTVTVDVTTGVVTGSGTTFDAGMVGKGFKAAGHTKWYRVKTYSSATSIVIENDSDDDTSAYDGGAIGAGATYIVQADEAVQVTKSNIYEKINAMTVILDEAKIPREMRWLVVPPAIASLIRQAPEFIPAVPAAYEEVVKRGLVGGMAGFGSVYQNNQVAGNGTDGWHVMGGHKSAITHAVGFVETGIEDLIGNFGKAYKGLTVYGSKVVDERRKGLVEGFFKL